MRRVSVLSTLALTLSACGPSARPGDIPPNAPDFAAAGQAGDGALAMGDADEDDFDDEDEGGFGGAGGAGAFEAAAGGERPPGEAGSDASDVEDEDGDDAAVEQP